MPVKNLIRLFLLLILHIFYKVVKIYYYLRGKY